MDEHCFGSHKEELHFTWYIKGSQRFDQEIKNNLKKCFFFNKMILGTPCFPERMEKISM